MGAELVMGDRTTGVRKKVAWGSDIFKILPIKWRIVV